MFNVNGMAGMTGLGNMPNNMVDPNMLNMLAGSLGVANKTAKLTTEAALILAGVASRQAEGFDSFIYCVTTFSKKEFNLLVKSLKESIKQSAKENKKAAKKAGLENLKIVANTKNRIIKITW